MSDDCAPFIISRLRDYMSDDCAPFNRAICDIHYLTIARHSIPRKWRLSCLDCAIIYLTIARHLSPFETAQMAIIKPRKWRLRLIDGTMRAHILFSKFNDIAIFRKARNFNELDIQSEIGNLASNFNELDILFSKFNELDISILFSKFQ